MAVRAHREVLLRGETVRLTGVGFTPKPKAGTVEIIYRGLEQLEMGSRVVAGES